LAAATAICSESPIIIGDAVVDLRRLVVVRQDDGVARALLEVVDRLHVGRHHRPLDRRDDVLDALVEMRGLAGDLVGIGEIRHGDRRELVDLRKAGRSAPLPAGAHRLGHRLPPLFMLKLSII
jgi:hypothetical protein